MGDLEQLEKSIAEDYAGSLGTLAKTPLRSYKNIGIVVITLASRAAIRGGVLPEISFSLSDVYINQIEDTNDIASLTLLIREAEYEYTSLVKETKEQKRKSLPNKQTPIVNKCKDYIFSHLHSKLQVSDIADELQMNANYLSEIFHECEGISITNYILKEKIKLAKNLLIYSKYSYIEIASYLGFSSQSHFGKQFKKTTGYTPGEFRGKFSVKGF